MDRSKPAEQGDMRNVAVIVKDLSFQGRVPGIEAVGAVAAYFVQAAAYNSAAVGQGIAAPRTAVVVASR